MVFKVLLVHREQLVLKVSLALKALMVFKVLQAHKAQLVPKVL